MTAPTTASLPALIRALASAERHVDGIRAALQVVGDALQASHVQLDLPGRGAVPIGWRPPNGEASTAGGTADVTHRVPVVAAGQVVATVRVVRPTSCTADERDWLAAVADLLAVSLAREAHLQELEHELTARVRELADQRAFIECVVDSLPVGLYVVDREYRIQAWNHKREIGLQGVARHDAIGRTIFEVLSRQPADMLKQEFDEVFTSGRLQQFQMESQAFGEPRIFRISKIPMRMGGRGVTHVITIGEDITDWKAALDRTAQSEKLAALGQLAAGVMHEINNPLATIAACAETLSLHDELGAAARPPAELLHIIDLEVQRCKKIVNGLLDFARPKPATREPFDLGEVVQQALFLLQHHPRFKRIALVTELATDAPLLVEGDPDQVVQVLIALAMNAMDATPEGGRVFIRTQGDHGQPGHPRAVLEVADEGPGIPRALQAKVFEPFFTTKPPGQGTGLGLAICYGIVADHGGTIELVSPEGSGATFRVALPLAGVRAPVEVA